RRLFAEDAERGLALIDISRARFDVVLMNPPFGQPAEGTKELLDADYPACGHEIYAMFFQRALELCEAHGRVGAITNRTWLALKSLRGLRETVFGDRGAVTLCGDLGYGVLEAKVETAAVVIDRRANFDTVAAWVRLLKTRRKNALLYEVLQAASDGQAHPYFYSSASRRFRRLPESVYAYWMSEPLLERCAASPMIEATIGVVKQGSNTARDFRFLRLAWEVPPCDIGIERKWSRFAKGGEYRPYWDDIYLLLNWQRDGAEVRALGQGRPQNTQFFGRRGVTWPRLTSKGFGPRVFNEGCAFGDKGPTAFPDDAALATVLLAVLVSGPQRLLLSTRLAAADDQPGAAAKSYEVSIVGELPWPILSVDKANVLRGIASDAIAIVRDAKLETDPSCEAWVTFGVPQILSVGRGVALLDAARLVVSARHHAFVELADVTAKIDDVIADAYGFTDRDRQLMDEELEPNVARYPDPVDDPDETLFRSAYLTKDAIPGDALPGGLDAEVDVRVEYRRRRQHTDLRDEETLCRLFELSPRRLAAIRRRLDLLRAEDLKRCAADIVSWAVGVAFGRWDLRLLDHPEWIPNWLDPFGPLPRCSVGQLVDASGLPATPEHIASDAWLAARTDAASLPATDPDADGKPWVLAADGARMGRAEIGADIYPFGVSWDGILQDDALDDGAPARHTLDLYRYMSQVLESIYGHAHAERETELAAVLGANSLLSWLRRPDRFFADHLTRYSRGNRLPRRAPIYWPLSTASGGFTLWLYYPRLSGAMLAACVNRLRENEQALQREEAGLLAARRNGALSGEGQTR
ncbi:Eco57I restriction-modification methylase domain-containing protein, partial [Thiocapsa sp.]|uniref:Eco57I restriction-modification methylase domain-containing protein n=1 Tax=Thiocapsa sp. TaxID=2024551 RepID=UPI003593CBE6